MRIGKTDMFATGSRARLSGGLALCLMFSGASAVMLGSASSASAAETPVSSQFSDGQITLSNDHFHPGDTITITGTGLQVPDSLKESAGLPVAGLKVNGDDYNDFPWTLSGPSRTDPKQLATAGGSLGYETIVVEDGSFSVSLEIDENWDPNEPTSLLFLGGSLSTAVGGKTLIPNTRTLALEILGADETVQEITTTAHTPGSVLNNSVGVKVRNYRASTGSVGQVLAFRIGSQLIGDCASTDADGDWDGQVLLPDNGTIGTGNHKLWIGAADSCEAAKTAPPRPEGLTFTVSSAEVLSSSHNLAGDLDIKVNGFVRSMRGGQRVSVALSKSPVGTTKYAARDAQGNPSCVVTSKTGNATATVQMPNNVDLVGDAYVIFSAGDSCGAGGFDGPARQLAVPIVVNAAPAVAIVGPVAFSGTARIASTLTAAAPYPNRSDAVVSYQWLRNNAAIKGATARTYRLTAQDVNKRIAVRASVAVGGTAATKSSASRAVAPGAIVHTKKPSLTGKAKVGKKLKANAGTWSQTGLTVKYQWLRNGKAIKGATKSSYKLVKKDKKKKVTLKVTVAKPGYTAATATSLAKKVK